jgi:hypothetical protein
MKKTCLILTLFALLSFTAWDAHAQSSDSTFSVVTSPNPFDDELTLTIYPGNRTVKSVRIYDIIGNEVAHTELPLRYTPFSYTLNLAQLRPGFYFLNIYGDKGIIESRKIFCRR